MEVSLIQPDKDDSDNEVSESSNYEVFSTIKIPAISVFLAFLVTISVFPAIFILIESDKKCDSSDRFYNDLFGPFLFVLYNLFDFCGRFTAEQIKSFLNKKRILTFALLRTVFIPAILLCNVSNSQLPILFRNDAFPILFIIGFSFSNGYLASSAMMLGPSLVGPKDAGKAGTIMIFALTLGLLAGGCLSFLTVAISQG